MSATDGKVQARSPSRVTRLFFMAPLVLLMLAIAGVIWGACWLVEQVAIAP